MPKLSAACSVTEPEEEISGATEACAQIVLDWEQPLWSGSTEYLPQTTLRPDGDLMLVRSIPSSIQVNHTSVPQDSQCRPTDFVLHGNQFILGIRQAPPERMLGIHQVAAHDNIPSALASSPKYGQHWYDIPSPCGPLNIQIRNGQSFSIPRFMTAHSVHPSEEYGVYSCSVEIPKELLSSLLPQPLSCDMSDSELRAACQPQYPECYAGSGSSLQFSQECADQVANECMEDFRATCPIFDDPEGEGNGYVYPGCAAEHQCGSAYVASIPCQSPVYTCDYTYSEKAPGPYSTTWGCCNPTNPQ